jgi:uncharacterized Tic20 family protein
MSYQAENSGRVFDPAASPITRVLLIITFGFLALYLLLPIIAAIACGFGKDFHYPLMGDRLAKYLGYKPANDESAWLIEDHEDRWVAAMGHFSVIIALWGLLAPITAWMVQGKRSPFLKFQSIQTICYQVFVNVLFLVAGFFYFFGLIAMISITGLERSPDITSPGGMVGLVIFGISSLCASIIILIAPLFHILGQWAGYRVLKGDDYHYPIIGKLLERRMSKS